MTSATTLSGPTGDDQVSPLAPLPFPVAMAGASMTYYSLSTNGTFQLFPGSTGTASTAYSNTTIPSSTIRNAMVAPFWDDLYATSGRRA